MQLSFGTLIGKTVTFKLSPESPDTLTGVVTEELRGSEQRFYRVETTTGTTWYVQEEKIEEEKVK